MDEKLRDELRKLNSDLNTQLKTMTEEAHQLGLHRVTDMRLADGSWAIVPILAAKAEVLSALAILSAKRNP